MINPNRAPVVNGPIADVTIHAGYSIVSQFDNTSFIEPDGEVMSYSFTSNDSSVLTWLSLDNDTRTFSGVPPVNSAVGVYEVSLIADDTNVNSASGVATFIVTITENYPPMLDKGLASPNSSIVHYEFVYFVLSDAFKDPEGDAYTIRVEVIPAEFSVTYSGSDRSVRGTLTDNSKFGDYTLRFSVEDIWNVSTFTEDLTITINQNMPPNIISAAPDPS